jgi:Ca2+-binding RTX toxin-like protein
VLDGADRVRLEHFGSPSTIWGGDGDDDIHGGSGAGSTTVHGEGGDDVLSTSNNGGDAIVTGGSGDDEITIGEATGGYFSGGKGDDHIVYRSLAGFLSALRATAGEPGAQPIIDGGGGDDLIEADLLDPRAIDGGPGDDTLRYNGDGTIDAAVSDLETVILVSGSHEVFGSHRGEAIISLGGPETIMARGGRDVIDVENGTAEDTVDCGRGFDIVRADPGDSIAPNCELVL